MTGALGASAAGLRLLLAGARSVETEMNDPVQSALRAHLRPEPRTGWGIVLGEERLATAMIDLSDGLSSDLNRLCTASGVGALIDSASLPVDDRVTDLCGRRALDPLQLALHGGEDFELLFTVRPDNAARLPRRVDGVEIRRIGTILSSNAGVKISEGSRTWELRPGGWEHFR